jgi:hypothetical protein
MGKIVEPGLTHPVFSETRRNRPAICACSADFKSAVSRICNPQCLKIAGVSGFRGVCRMQFGDTADYKSALHLNASVVSSEHRLLMGSTAINPSRLKSALRRKPLANVGKWQQLICQILVVEICRSLRAVIAGLKA